MKNKTPLKQLLKAVTTLDPEALYKWIQENKERLTQAEREMVSLAYRSGQKFEYGIDPDDTSEDADRNPEPGNIYFDTRYGK